MAVGETSQERASLEDTLRRQREGIWSPKMRLREKEGLGRAGWSAEPAQLGAGVKAPCSYNLLSRRNEF